MFHPLRALFRHTKVGWEETDIKYYIERYFQNRFKAGVLYCEKVHEGVAVIRVNSPLIQQEVVLLEFELARELRKQTNYILRQLIVYTSR
ncbi:MAG: hypothetical protein WEA04_01780 [Candidatus Andersenbacteria bacterium]